MRTTLSAAAALALAAAGASADVISVQFTGTQSGQSVKIASPSYNGNVFAGQLKHTLSAGPAWLNGNWITYCVDLAQHVTSSAQTYDIVSVSSLPDSSPMGLAKAAAIRDLYVYSNGAQLTTGTSNDYAAAFQLALWEIVTDYNPSVTGGNLSLTAGSFTAKKTDGSALATGVTSVASTLFSKIGAAPESPITLLGLRSGTAQDQVIPVPAPGAATLAGLGLLAIAGRRRGR